VKLFGRRPSSEPSNRLEELLLAAANEVSARPQFYREFLDFDVYVLGEVVGPSVDLGEGRHKSLGQEVHAQGYGRAGIALSSSEARIREALDSPKAFIQSKYIRMNARALLESFPPGTPFVLNPRSSFGKEFHPDEVKAMLDGSTFRKADKFRIPPGEKYYLRKPPTPPEELIATLSDYFRRSDAITEAYLAEIYVPSSGEEPHLILGIGLAANASKQMEEMVPEIDVIIRNIVKPNEFFVDIIEMGAGQVQGFMREQTQPSFVR